jgi:hypothetical protein
MPASPFVPYNPITRVVVDYSMRGKATISWELCPHFFETEPWSFQVQVADSQLPTAAWTNVGNPVVGTLTTSIQDTTLRLPAGKEPQLFYRVVVTTSTPNTYISPVANVLGDLPKFLWLKYQELLRKELLMLSRHHVGGNEGILLRAKRSGQPCTACTDPNTEEQTDAQCPTCFGQRFVGGYYQAQAKVYFDNQPLSRYQLLDLQNRGNVNDATVFMGRSAGYPLLSTYDIWIDKTSDIRYFIHKVDTLYHVRMVPVAHQISLKLIPFDSIIYLFPTS